MSITNGYVTLAEVRAVLYTDTITYTGADTRIEKTVEAASRAIDKVCQRRFYKLPETRYYTADDGYIISVDDLTSISTLKTDDDGDGTYENTWTTGDYNLKHGDNYNALLDDKPYTEIEVSEQSDYSFPKNVKKGVQIYGGFGYTASTNSLNCPATIHDACLITVHRLFKRHDIPLGVQGGGNAQLGQSPIVIPRITLDPDVMDLLSPYVRYV